MTIESSLLLICVGLVGGAWNALAGGATLFTFPALMAVGLPPIQANATNYVAMLPSNAAAIPAYSWELKAIGWSQVWPLLAVSGVGSVVGSLLLLVSIQALFEVLIPFLILLATLLFAFGTNISAWVSNFDSSKTSSGALYFALFFFSIYGGYFGAGLGIILLAIVQIMGFTSFHMANSLKNLLATSFTMLSIVVFGVGGIIAWPEALTMMTGSALGGYFGARYGRLVNEYYLRKGIIAFGLILSGYYFYKSTLLMSGAEH